MALKISTKQIIRVIYWITAVIRIKVGTQGRLDIDQLVIIRFKRMNLSDQLILNPLCQKFRKKKIIYGRIL